jgi:hypothetical protein
MRTRCENIFPGAAGRGNKTGKFILLRWNLIESCGGGGASSNNSTHMHYLMRFVRERLQITSHLLSAQTQTRELCKKVVFCKQPAHKESKFALGLIGAIEKFENLFLCAAENYIFRCAGCLLLLLPFTFYAAAHKRRGDTFPLKFNTPWCATALIQFARSHSEFMCAHLGVKLHYFPRHHVRI